MVVEHRTNFRRLLRQIGKPLTLMFGCALALTVLNRSHHVFRAVALPDVSISIMGAVLGILLGFRTNTAYARWWEARTLWGALVNTSRTLARQALSFLDAAGTEGEEMARGLVHHQIAFVHALRCHLRKQDPLPALAGLLQPGVQAELEGMRNIPAALLRRMGMQAAEAARRGMLTEWRLQQVDGTLTALSNIQGGCERIKNTPLPRQYDYYPELFVKLYCLLLPLVLVDELGWLTPVVVSLVALVFLVLNRIGKNLEDPFENTVYDVPISALATTIEIDLRQALGETRVPDAPRVVDEVLW